jgi:hypothetical protein
MSLCFQPYLTMGYVYHAILSYKNTIQSWDAGVCVLKNTVLTEWTPIDYKHQVKYGWKHNDIFLGTVEMFSCLYRNVGD